MRLEAFYLALLLLLPTAVVRETFGSSDVSPERRCRENVAVAQRRVSSLRANFVQTKKVALLRAPLVSRGELEFRLPDYVRWSVKTPEPMELSFGAGPRAGENSSGTVPEGSDPSLAELFRGLSSIFVQGELDQSRFRLEAPSQDVGQNRCGFRVVPLLPQLARILISIEVHADMKSGRPAAAILREVGGDETRIELSDVVVGEHR